MIVVALLAAVGAYFAATKVLDMPPPTEAEVSAAFVPLDGLTYEDMPAGTLQPLEDAFASQTDATEAVAHFDAKQVMNGSDPVAVVFILSVDPDLMGGDFEDSYVTGFAATSQTTVQELSIGESTGRIAETAQGTIAFFFDEDGYVFNVVGRERETVGSIADSLEAGNS